MAIRIFHAVFRKWLYFPERLKNRHDDLAQIFNSYWWISSSKEVIYMSPFWNHILSEKGRFIHVCSQISWYVCSMYLGTKGIIFFYTCTFCALLPHRCVLLCEDVLYIICTPLSYTRYVKFSNTPIFMSKYPACVLLTICCLTTWRPTSNFKPPSNT